MPTVRISNEAYNSLHRLAKNQSMTKVLKGDPFLSA
jgi:hypothetical protein